ncbi:MFS transporter [Streptomyces sp. C11-1]|uniref:MFS transporter n=1 Tax=Streptomyces durocortorensis TaxID=2811104 RepID=A0ABY9WB81_9ACTN|nr:MFS transporter [Streptomyces durocortorensis]WNF31322.1 MFS transporter [Streptomyces durocortorensis]
MLVDAASTPALLYWAVKDLAFATYDLHQIQAGYVLAFCSLLFVGGHIADLVGRRTTLLIGLTGFALAAVVGATAAGPEALVVSLVLRGVFAALITPAAFGLVAAQFTEPGERRKAFGVYSVTGLGGVALALFIAVPLTESTTWRLALYAVAGLSLVALIGTATLVRDWVRRAPARFDGPGALLSTLGIAAVVFGLAQVLGGWGGWGEPLMVPALVLGVVLLAAFAWQQSRAGTSPILPAYATGTRDRLGASLVLFLIGLALAPVASLLGAFLISLGPLASLPAFLVMAGAFLIGSLAVAARLLPRIGPRALLVPGLLLAAVGVMLIELAQDSVSSTVPSMICVSVGLGMVGTVLYSTITDGIAAHDSGGRGGLVMANQHLGGELAFALLGGTLFQLSSVDPVLVYGAAGVLAVAALLGGLLIKGPARTVAPAEPWSAPTLPG